MSKMFDSVIFRSVIFRIINFVTTCDWNSELRDFVYLTNVVVSRKLNITETFC